MRTKKVIGILILIITLFATICIVNTNSYAGVAELGITNVREQNEAYGLGGRKSDGTPLKKIWKIVSYGENDTVDYSKAYYCIKAEHGFVSNTTSNVSLIRKTYNDFYNMKTQADTVKTKLDAINATIPEDISLKSQTYYNQIMWIIDNMYIKNAPNAVADRQNLLTSAKITGESASFLTDNDIEVVQQLALWYFTNPNDTNYHANSAEDGKPKIPSLLFSRQGDTGYQDLADMDVVTDEDTGFELRRGLIRQNLMEDLYRYFITTANANSNYTSQEITSPMTLTTTNFGVRQDGERFIVGPLTINIDSSKTYNITELMFKDQTGAKIELQGDNQLLNSNSEVVTSGNLQDVIGQQFYISLPINTTITKVSFSIKGNYNAGTTATFCTTTGNTYVGEQPVVLVERGSKNYQDGIEIQMPAPKHIDLALRKFITKRNTTAITNRIPQPDLAKLISKDSTTATYNHPKSPLPVKVGDIVTYTIRIYNEGELDAYASEITDHLPNELEFLPEDAENLANGWHYAEEDLTLRTIKTSILAKDGISEDNLIKAFDGTTLKFKEITVKCKVKSSYNVGENIIKVASGDKITNIAEISKCTDENGKDVTATSILRDRDSLVGQNLTLPEDQKLPEYTGGKNKKNDPYYDGSNVIESENGKYYAGQEDDDDFEKIQIQTFDLALRKFITAIDNTAVSDRIPAPTMGTDGNIKYVHTKEPKGVQTGNVVTYTIRVFNEGDLSGYATEITDDLPAGLLYLPENDLNKLYRWKMIDKDGKETKDVTKAVKVTTDYLSKEQEKTSGGNLINAFNSKSGITAKNPDYKDIKIAFKVTEPNTSNKILTNTAQISEDSDEFGKPIDDIDSIPGNNVLTEDDIDVEHVKLIYFDLALRKFITKVDNLDVNNRIPVLSIDEKGNIKYTHTKEPVDVENGNIVTYTIRIFNEGTLPGYATEITDDLPEGLLYLPENETNKEYKWKMIDKDGKETEDVTKAVKITTNYLSKEQEKQAGANLIKAFNSKAGITANNPDYRDVKIAFKVTEPNTSDRILINTAEISEDSDEFGKPIDDIDSTPGNNKDGEDDIDIEKVKVRYFDLALKKWVTQAIVIENGKETITNTGHTGNENPEPVVKVDLKDKKINKLTVKFRYTIKVTNEGQIEGYVKELKDYIPEGLKFVAEDNPDWKQVSENVVTTTKLENRLLKPGESDTVEILLTWINSDKNLGLKVNVAEISKDYNDKDDTPDIDSTPDNKKEGEDDIDEAPVILSVKTGDVKIYFTLTLTILVTLAGGIYLIKKYVL